MAEFENGRRLEASNPDAANVIKSLPWVADGRTRIEGARLSALIDFALQHPILLHAYTQKTGVEEAIPLLDSAVLSRLSDISAEFADEVSVMARVFLFESRYQDSYTEISRWQEISKSHPKYFSAVWQYSWVRDGVEPDEWAVVMGLRSLGTLSPDSAMAIVSLPFLDAHDGDDFASVGYLVVMAETNPQLFDLVWQLPWVSDGLEPFEWSLLQQLASLALLAPDNAAKIVHLPFLETAEPADVDEISALARMAWLNSAEFRVLIDDHGLEKATSRDASEIQRDLDRISRRMSSRAVRQRIAEMPFLETMDAADANAVEAMRRLALEGNLGAILEHPALREGITDEQAKIVATLYGVMENSPPLLDALLDPEQVLIENRVISLPLAGETLLTIIRTRPGSDRSMNLLEAAVRNAEEFMGVPFSTNYVAMQISYAVSPHSAGTHFVSYFAMKPEYDAIESNRRTNYAPTVIAHEVGHYYWTGDLRWINEGGADLLSIMSEHRREGSAVAPNRKPCAQFENIRELEATDLESGDDGHRCYYRLGQRFFLDMYVSLGEEAFRRGFRNYHLSDAAGIIGIKAAFKNSATTKQARMVDEVIARWYDGTAPRTEPAAESKGKSVAK